PDNQPSSRALSSVSISLAPESALLRRARVVVPLGQIAFATYLRIAQEHHVTLPRPRPRFKHGAVYRLHSTSPIPSLVIASYHPSRQNTQTGRLTEAMLDRVFREARRLLRQDGTGG